MLSKCTASQIIFIESNEIFYKLSHKDAIQVLSLMVYGYVQLNFVFALKMIALASALLLAVALNPDWHVTYPWDIKTIFYSLSIATMVIAMFLEIKLNQVDKGISGLTALSMFGIVYMLVGIGFIVYFLGFHYGFGDMNLNRWIAYYMLGGAVIIFAQSREELFHNKLLKANVERLRGRE